MQISKQSNNTSSRCKCSHYLDVSKMYLCYQGNSSSCCSGFVCGLTWSVCLSCYIIILSLTCSVSQVSHAHLLTYHSTENYKGIKNLPQLTFYSVATLQYIPSYCPASLLKILTTTKNLIRNMGHPLYMVIHH